MKESTGLDMEKLCRQRDIPSPLFPGERTLIGYDWLTMLPNRYQFESYLEAALLNAERFGETGYVIMIDVDDFKLINWEYSFKTGDRLISVIADYLASNFAKDHTLFRIGADSFSLVNAGGSDEQLRQVTRAIYRRCQSSWQVDKNTLYCTLSITAIRYPDHVSNVDEIHKVLSAVVFQIKSSGKNNILFCDEIAEYISNNVILQYQEIEKMLRDSISNRYRGFYVEYQPIYRAKTNNPVGAEALVRFSSERGIVIPPDHFIPLTEANGMILSIGDYVLQNAAICCKTVNCIIDPAFCVSVNVSVRQFQLPGYANRVLTLLSDVGVCRENIILEITEGLAAANMERIRNTCAELRKAGISIALDDLGTGYSSLNMLRTMPVDIVKIDRSFIKDLATDTYSQHFVRLITELSHILNLQVCAEGVEDAAQLNLCEELMIDYIQGYCFQKPMPKDRLLETLMRS